MTTFKITSSAGQDTGTCDYESYWNAVLGASRDADAVCREFVLIGRDGLDEWLGTAESEARAISTDGFPSREDCERWHNEALEELAEASGGVDALKKLAEQILGNEPAFQPTHMITDNDGAEIPVQCIDGACYTEHEWAHDERADWELTDDDGLLFQGQAVAASYRTV